MQGTFSCTLREKPRENHLRVKKPFCSSIVLLKCIHLCHEVSHCSAIVISLHTVGFRSTRGYIRFERALFS
jgi:hypothetical protein